MSRLSRMVAAMPGGGIGGVRARVIVPASLERVTAAACRAG